MDRKREVEKKFAEYLDRILAGEEIPTDPGMDEELHAALDFARKMSEIRPDPSESYQAQLKARLLQKLDEQEAIAREKQGRFWKSIWRQPVWQGAIMVAFAVVVVGLLWRAGAFAPEFPEATTTPTISPTTTTITPTQTIPPPPTTTTTVAPTTAPTTTPTQIPQEVFISVYADTDKLVYQPGEEVMIGIVLTNDGPTSITLENLPPIVSLMAADTQQPVFTFSAGNEIRTLTPNQTVHFILTWNQEDFDGESVTGLFYVEIEDLIYNGQPILLHLDQPVQFDILTEL